MTNFIITLFLLSCASTIRVGNNMKIANADCNGQDTSTASALMSFDFYTLSDSINSIYTSATVMVPCSRYHVFTVSVELDGKPLDIKIDGNGKLYNVPMNITPKMKIEELSAWWNEFDTNLVIVNSSVKIEEDHATISLSYVSSNAIQVLEQYKRNFDFAAFAYEIESDQNVVEYEIEQQNERLGMTNEQLQMLMQQAMISKLSPDNPNAEVHMKGQNGEDIILKISQHIVKAIDDNVVRKMI